MPKIRRERVRRHVIASGPKSMEEDDTQQGVAPEEEEKAPIKTAGEGIVWEPVKPLDLSDFVVNKQTDTVKGEVGMDVEPKNENKKAAAVSTATATATAAEEGSSKPKKKQTKKEKLQSRHQKLMSRLMLPGEKQKFETKRLDLSALAEVIDDKEAPVVSKMTSHTRKAVATSEIGQFKLVFQHPAFQQDALAAIKQHLQIVDAAREEAEVAQKPKRSERFHPYAKSPSNEKKTPAAANTSSNTTTVHVKPKQQQQQQQQQQKPNPNKGKHTRKKGRAETIRKR